MKNILHIAMLFVFTFSVFSAKAQNEELKRYWDDVDFSDTTLVASETMSEKLVNYFFSFTDGDEQRFDSLSIAGLSIVLDKAKVKMGRDQVTDYLLNYPQLAEGEVDMNEGLRLDSITEPYQKVKVGAKAPDYSGVTIDGDAYCLYGSEAKHIIIVFWSTDCEYCHDFLVQIRKNLDLKSDFELVTFALADNEDEVKQAVKKMRLPGYHFYDALRWEAKVFLDYHITSTPTVFLLDADKTIICKPYDWKDLKDWLKQNK